MVEFLLRSAREESDRLLKRIDETRTKKFGQGSPDQYSDKTPAPLQRAELLHGLGNIARAGGLARFLIEREAHH